MKFKIISSAALTIIILLIGYLSFLSNEAAKVVLTPGLVADFWLAAKLTPQTIGLGGMSEVIVILSVSGAVWFSIALSASVCWDRLVCHRPRIASASGS